jgi:epoxyqueuosine reductase
VATSSARPPDRARLLKGWALELGFDRAGAASLEPARTGAAYLAWLARGDHAGMAYMAHRIEARLDPRRLLPGARSAVCVALRYAPLAGEPPARGLVWDHVARYARGRDYHNTMGRRLRRLASRIRAEFPGAAARACVDTSPVLERELAAAAGLGAVGKNTMLLDPEGGSYFLLGEVLTTLELAPDEPLADLCGTCTRCLEACPTGALAAPYRLDARKCISYWTIEHRGSIPPHMRGQLEGWVFGCDLCQEACPWNERAAPTERPEFAPAPERRELDLAGLLGLTREAYGARLRGSPLQRARREGLQRNAALALGARGGVDPQPALRDALRTGEPVVRGHAAWALGRLGTAPARKALGEALGAEAAAEVRAEVLAALAACDAGRRAEAS